MTLNPKQFDRQPDVHYWAEHANMPGRPTGLHAYTVEPTIKGALQNIHSEIMHGENNGRPRVPDGSHHISVMRFQPGSGEGPKKIYVVGHTVENGKSVPHQGGFIPDISRAINEERG